MALERLADIPDSYGKELQACLGCRLVKTYDQFLSTGCDNCETALALQGDRERVADCTTRAFQGLVAVADPKTSWAAKWLHLRGFASGVYALSIDADVPQYVDDLLREHNITRAASLATATAAPRPVVRQRRGALKVEARSYRKDPDVEIKAKETNQQAQELVDQANKFWDDLKVKWDTLEEKPAAIAAAVAVFVALYALNGVVDAVNSLPLISNLFELVGLLVTGWFTYRYLLFGPDRQELKAKVDSYYEKITGKSR